MRISDWSSDVCSSDLHRAPRRPPRHRLHPRRRPRRRAGPAGAARLHVDSRCRLTHVDPRHADGVTKPFGVYLHVPFCAARCDYCSFATWTDRHHLTDAYLAACRVDADRLVAAGMPPATSIFVGGGTPSMVPPGDLVAVLDRVPRAPGCEVDRKSTRLNSSH